MNKDIDTTIVKGLKGLSQDSRAIKPGYLFAALPGSKTDGGKYIEDALRHGASAILLAEGQDANVPAEMLRDVQIIRHANPRRALALLAAAFYSAQPKTIVAVTGTNGKTSTVHFVKQIWTHLGYKAASIGTLGVRAPGKVRSGSMTTPDPVSLQAELADLAAAGITHLAMEASSHGLDQHRLDGVRLQAAAFSNLTHDHLDYHGTMEAYFAAKARLFTDVVQEGGTAVLNADVPEFLSLESMIGKRTKILSYGRAGRDIMLQSHTPTPHGQTLSLCINGVDVRVDLPLAGAFQAMNVLCALGLVMATTRLEGAQVQKILQNLQGVPGRMELAGTRSNGAAVYVDYAHTPDALETVLQALRPHTRGRLICLFGCGGDRDRGKRPMMGQIATTLADVTLVTDDNPRSENPASIRAAILAAAPGAIEMAGRHHAILQAVADLQAGDVLLIAGKGHEQGQIFENHTEPFDDVEEAQNALKEHA